MCIYRDRKIEMVRGIKIKSVVGEVELLTERYNHLHTIIIRRLKSSTDNSFETVTSNLCFESQVIIQKSIFGIIIRLPQCL